MAKKKAVARKASSDSDDSGTGSGSGSGSETPPSDEEDSVSSKKLNIYKQYQHICEKKKKPLPCVMMKKKTAPLVSKQLSIK